MKYIFLSLMLIASNAFAITTRPNNTPESSGSMNYIEILQNNAFNIILFLIIIISLVQITQAVLKRRKAQQKSFASRKTL